MLEIFVYPPGTKVKIGDGISGQIIAVQIYQGPRVIYNISWWKGHEQESGWFDTFEIEFPPDVGTKKIGFYK